MRRFTRLTNGFGKKVENHDQGLRSVSCSTTSPCAFVAARSSAMEAGISDQVWSLEDLRSLLPKAKSAAKRVDKKLILGALGG